jgi:hypothetical protein
VLGEAKIGKSALAKFIGNYVLDRRKFDYVYWIPVGTSKNDFKV